MPDIEKVIKALEHCKDNQYVNDCDKCDYSGKTGMFCLRMIDDVIAWLKEQEEKMKHLNNITLEYEKEVFRLQTLLKEQKAIIEQYHKADIFLEAHGWKWEGR